MIDGQGRTIDYLRISLTDRCNLRCAYCMPPEGVPCLSHEEILRLEEIGYLTEIMAGMGLKKVRLTGGEPLVRKNVTSLIRQISHIPGIETVAVTTNGILLPKMLSDLKDAGLKAVNISIDTLDEAVFQKITGAILLKEVLEGIDIAYASGLKVKLNCVPVMEFNSEEPVRLAAFAKDRFIDVRFIELMPIGCGRFYTRITSEEILESLEKVYGKATRLPYEGKGPAQYFSFEGFKGRIGFISPISHKFCSECNRLRLTSDGKIKLCLYYKDGVDVRDLIRNGADEGRIREAIEEALRLKPREHYFCEPDKGNTEVKKMSQIGG